MKKRFVQDYDLFKENFTSADFFNPNKVEEEEEKAKDDKKDSKKKEDKDTKSDDDKKDSKEDENVVSSESEEDTKDTDSNSKSEDKKEKKDETEAEAEAEEENENVVDDNVDSSDAVDSDDDGKQDNNLANSFNPNSMTAPRDFSVVRMMTNNGEKIGMCYTSDEGDYGTSLGSNLDFQAACKLVDSECQCCGLGQYDSDNDEIFGGIPKFMASKKVTDNNNYNQNPTSYRP